MQREDELDAAKAATQFKSVEAKQRAAPRRHAAPPKNRTSQDLRFQIETLKRTTEAVMQATMKTITDSVLTNIKTSF